MTSAGDHSQGVQGARSDPLASRAEDTSGSEVSDSPTACSDPYPLAMEPPSAKRGRASRTRVDTRFDEGTLAAVRARAKRLRLPVSTWIKALVRDALDARRTDEVDAVIGAALLHIEARAQVSADARHLAAQIRPLAINLNDLDARARSGQAVTMSPDNGDLIDLLREVRELLGDRVAS